MCFGSSSKDDGHNEEAPRPAQVPSQQQQSYAKPPSVKMSAPEKKQQQQQYPLDDMAGGSEFAPPSAPPPSHRAPETDYAPPSGPPPSQQRQQQAEYAPPAGPPPGQRQQDEYAPPSGPPPARQQDKYAPPSGPPPSQRQNAEYAPPAGPPPSHRQDDFAPPPGPPPSHGGGDYTAPPLGPPPSHRDVDYAAPPPGPPPSQKEKPQHDWESVVPDTSLFPPPPDIFSGFDRSPATNATEAQANAGEAWVKRYPLSAPARLDAAALGALAFHNPRLMAPPPNTTYRGTLAWVAPGTWAGKTDRRSGDNCIVGYPPLYAVTEHSPLATGRPRTIYYEVKVRADCAARETTLAIGYTALPYPTFRMPGWHRGSLAVHGDDGHKYVNDRWGGKSFTAPFRKGETYGLGMTLAPAGGKISVDVFFTRNGVEAGRWNLHEETDAEQDLPVTGLEGFHDLSCAVGTFEDVNFEVIFEPSRWMYQGVVE